MMVEYTPLDQSFRRREISRNLFDIFYDRFRSFSVNHPILQPEFFETLSEDQLFFINKLFRSIDSNSFPVKTFTKFICDEQMASVVSAMATHHEACRMPLGLLLSHVSIDQFSPDIRNQLAPHQSSYDLSVKTNYRKWSNCPLSEENLMKSLFENGVLLAGERDLPYFLVKFRGKMTGFCLRNIVTKTGNMFIQGNLYSPTDQKTRLFLRREFDKGQSRVLLTEGSWALMRSVVSPKGHTDAKFWNIISSTVSKLPDSYPSTDIYVLENEQQITMSRRDYRLSYKEDPQR